MSRGLLSNKYGIVMVFDRVDKWYDPSSITRQEEIELNKNFSKVLSNARRTIKPERCFFCDKKVTSTLLQLKLA